MTHTPFGLSRWGLPFPPRTGALKALKFLYKDGAATRLPSFRAAKQPVRDDETARFAPQKRPFCKAGKPLSQPVGSQRIAQNAPVYELSLQKFASNKGLLNLSGKTKHTKDPSLLNDKTSGRTYIFTHPALSSERQSYTDAPIILRNSAPYHPPSRSFRAGFPPVVHDCVLVFQRPPYQGVDVGEQ